VDRRIIYVFSGLILGSAIGIAVFYGFPNLEAGSGTVGSTRISADSADFLDTEVEGFSSRPSGPQIGSPAPDFTLQDLDGNVVKLEETLGKVVLLNFWATWCGPCRIEMPFFERTYTEYKDEDFVVLAVDFDEPVEAVRAFQKELNLNFPILLDPGGEVQRTYRVLGYPTSVLIDREGLIHAIHVGIMSEAQLDDYLEELGVGE
jgi:peroxiredoxin